MKKILSLVLCLILTACGEVIDTGNRGVRTWFGDVTSEKPLSEGLYFYLPVAGNIVEYECKTQVYTGTFSTYTKDMQPSEIEIAINYSLNRDEVALLHKEVGKSYERTVLRPRIEADVKDIIGQWDAASLVANREKASQQILELMKVNLNERHIVVESVSIKNIDYSDAFERAIEAKVVAKQKAEEAKNRTIEVEETAKQKVISAEAEAKSMQIRSQALSQNKNLVEYEAVQKWDGKLPVNIYGSAPIPFINTLK